MRRDTTDAVQRCDHGVPIITYCNRCACSHPAWYVTQPTLASTVFRCTTCGKEETQYDRLVMRLDALEQHAGILSSKLDRLMKHLGLPMI